MNNRAPFTVKGITRIVILPMLALAHAWASDSLLAAQGRFGYFFPFAPKGPRVREVPPNLLPLAVTRAHQEVAPGAMVHRALFIRSHGSEGAVYVVEKCRDWRRWEIHIDSEGVVRRSHRFDRISLDLLPSDIGRSATDPGVAPLIALRSAEEDSIRYDLLGVSSAGVLVEWRESRSRHSLTPERRTDPRPTKGRER